MLDMAGGLEKEPKEVYALPRPQDTAESCRGVPMAQVPVPPPLPLGEHGTAHIVPWAGIPVVSMIKFPHPSAHPSLSIAALSCLTTSPARPQPWCGPITAPTQRASGLPTL